MMFKVVFLLTFFYETLQIQPDIFELIKKHPTWSFQLESVDAFIQRSASSVNKFDPTLTKSELQDRIRSELGSETSHIVWKVGDPKWPRNPPRNFDSREKWKDCADLIGSLNDEGSCLADAPVVAASILTDRLCIHTNGTWKAKLSGQNSAGCQELCTMESLISRSFAYAVKYGISAGGYYHSKEGCLPYDNKPCIHANTSFPDNNETSSIGGVRIAPKKEDLPLCSDFTRYDYDCPTKCSNKNYHKSFEDDLIFPTTWYYTSYNEFAIRQEIMSYGPVATGIRLYADFLDKPEGIYFHDGDFDEPGKYLMWYKHLKLIGWGEENGQKYWIGVNTWDQWGDDKVFRIPRGTDHVSVEHLLYASVFAEL